LAIGKSSGDSTKSNGGSTQADERFASLQTELRTGVTEWLDSIQRSMIHLAVGLTTGMLAGFAAMVGLVATQL
jgi:hypothetical protein